MQRKTVGDNVYNHYTEKLLHGTKVEFVPSICTKGIDRRFSKCGTRCHIHLSDREEAVKRGEKVAGVRDGSTAVVVVVVASKRGVAFSQSAKEFLWLPRTLCSAKPQVEKTKRPNGRPDAQRLCYREKEMEGRTCKHSSESCC